MRLYFSPLACSLASRIALYEAGAQAHYTQVDGPAKQTVEGIDYYMINPMGLVPALLTDDGELITENTAILQFVADQFPQANLAPPSGRERTRLHQWLSFIGTELHKAVFLPLFDSREEIKNYGRGLAPKRFGVLERHLSQQEFLLERYSVADGYLTTILNWTAVTGVDLEQWPAVLAYHKRLLKRPAIAKAFGEELALYKEEQARRAKA
jgi:glutathione S-transferase